MYVVLVKFNELFNMECQCGHLKAVTIKAISLICSADDFPCQLCFEFQNR